MGTNRGFTASLANALKRLAGKCVKYKIRMKNSGCKANYLFLGDYVNRGKQSPVELDISLKSNALVERAILTPSRIAIVESDDVIVSGSLSAKSHKDVVLDHPSDSQKTLEDLPDKVEASSGAGSVTANDACDLGEGDPNNSFMKAIDLQEPNIVRFVMSRSNRSRRKKRESKQLMRESNLQMEE